MGTSLSSAASAFDKPNRAAALAACGLVSFIWPSSAPTSSTGEVPPIFSWICFQLHPFSRLMSRIFSVSSARVMAVSLAFGRGIALCPVLGECRPRRRGRRPFCGDDWPRAPGSARVRRIECRSSARCDLRRARLDDRDVTGVVVRVLHFLGEIPAAAYQKVDDVVAHAVIERVAMNVVALAFLG